MIISDGFKGFHSTLTKTIFQTGSSSEYLKWLSIQSWEIWIQPESKVFRNPSQSTTEYRKLWRGFCRLSKNQWRQVIRKQSSNSRRRANLSVTTAPRREGQNPRLITTAVVRREGQNPRLITTAVIRRESWNLRLCVTAASRREGRNPRLSYNYPHYWVNYCPRNEGVSPHCGAFL